MIVRRAEPRDLQAIVEIYNHYVLHSVATFDLDPVAVEERQSWFQAFDDEDPLYVCEADGTVLGYAYYMAFRARLAYARSKECTVYVSAAHQRKGAGKALYARLIEHARARDVHTLIGVLGGVNEASAGLHRHFGFELAGRLREVGYKLGQYVDTFYYQKRLGRP